MWIRVLIVSVLAFLIGYAIWDFVRVNPQLLSKLMGLRNKTGPRPRRIVPDPGTSDTAGQILSFRRRPHSILGVPEDATLDEARNSWARQKAENDPEKLADMSDDLRSMAEVRRKELDQAWQAFQDERA